MKNVIKSLTAVAALTALMAGPASAMVSQDDLNRSINSALSAGSNVFGTIKGDTVTLGGYFADAGDKNRALQAANLILKRCKPNIGLGIT